MDETKAQEMISQIFQQVFGTASPYSLDEVLAKFAFDLKLPQKVYDSITGEETWSETIHGTKFITQKNMEKHDMAKGWMLPKQEVKILKELLAIWQTINYITTEREYDCIDVAQCDPIYRSEKCFRSTDCSECKSLVFCDGCHRSEFMLASQRTVDSGFCIRVDDSNTCTNSYHVMCSKQISNSLFIQDCSNLHECIFCSHISSRSYCISNMQFEKSEYFAIKKAIVKWILSKT